jgi:hypothetical protein
MPGPGWGLTSRRSEPERPFVQAQETVRNRIRRQPKGVVLTRVVSPFVAKESVRPQWGRLRHSADPQTSNNGEFLVRLPSRGFLYPFPLRAHTREWCHLGPKRDIKCQVMPCSSGMASRVAKARLSSALPIRPCLTLQKVSRNRFPQLSGENPKAVRFWTDFGPIPVPEAPSKTQNLIVWWSMVLFGGFRWSRAIWTLPFRST